MISEVDTSLDQDLIAAFLDDVSVDQHVDTYVNALGVLAISDDDGHYDFELGSLA